MSKYDIEVPEIEPMLAVMRAHFENERYSEAWGLREHWTMLNKELSSWKPKTLEKIDFKNQKLSEVTPLTRALQSEHDELESEVDWIEYRRKARMEEMRRTMPDFYSNPYMYLEFVEAKLRQYGSHLEGIKDTEASDKAHHESLMNGLIYDMHAYFNVWVYDDLFSIDDENIRLKIAELVRLNMKYQGIDPHTTKQRAESVIQGKSLESLL